MTSTIKSKKRKLATHQHWLLTCDLLLHLYYHGHNNNSCNIQNKPQIYKIYSLLGFYELHTYAVYHSRE